MWMPSGRGWKACQRDRRKWLNSRCPPPPFTNLAPRHLRPDPVCGAVRFLAGGDSIVESLRLRPAFSRVAAANGPASAPLAKQTIKLTDGLLAWWVLNEARVVADVVPKSQLLAMSLDAKAPSPSP